MLLSVITDGPKILDLTYLAEAADGDAEFVDEILADYLVETAKQLIELEKNYRIADMKPLIRAAHTIKGASANVGATRVQETAAKLESRANCGKLDGGESLICLLHQELDRVKDLVEREGVERLLNTTV